MFCRAGWSCQLSIFAQCVMLKIRKRPCMPKLNLLVLIILTDHPARHPILMSLLMWTPLFAFLYLMFLPLLMFSPMFCLTPLLFQTSVLSILHRLVNLMLIDICSCMIWSISPVDQIFRAAGYQFHLPSILNFSGTTHKITLIRGFLIFWNLGSPLTALAHIKCVIQSKITKEPGNSQRLSINIWGRKFHMTLSLAPFLAIPSPFPVRSILWTQFPSVVVRTDASLSTSVSLWGTLWTVQFPKIAILGNQQS